MEHRKKKTDAKVYNLRGSVAEVVTVAAIAVAIVDQAEEAVVIAEADQVVVAVVTVAADQAEIAVADRVLIAEAVARVAEIVVAEAVDLVAAEEDNSFSLTKPETNRIEKDFIIVN